jgi:hypothetical protein
MLNFVVPGVGVTDLMEGQPEQRYVLVWDKLWDLNL